MPSTLDPSKLLEADFAPLAERFLALEQAKVQYVILSGYTGLPSANPDHILILTSQLGPVVNMLRLKKKRAEGCYLLHTAPPGGVKEIDCFVVEKGHGVFPDRYEADLLKHGFYQNGVRLPDPHYHAPASLYYKLYHEGWLREDNEQRRLFCEYVGNIVGIMTAARYGWMKNFPG